MNTAPLACMFAMLVGCPSCAMHAPTNTTSDGSERNDDARVSTDAASEPVTADVPARNDAAALDATPDRETPTSMPMSCDGIEAPDLTRQFRGEVRYPSGQFTFTDHDLTRWVSLWGTDPQSSDGVVRTFPGAGSLLAAARIGRTQYVALEFRTPEASAVPERWGNFSVIETWTESASTMTISTCPGDFRVDTLPFGCAHAGGALYPLYWSLDHPVDGVCHLEHGQRYYLNVVPKVLPPRAPVGRFPRWSAGCPDATCSIDILNMPF